jgi:hypothetical protein
MAAAGRLVMSMGWRRTTLTGQYVFNGVPARIDASIFNARPSHGGNVAVSYLNLSISMRIHGLNLGYLDQVDE